MNMMIGLGRDKKMIILEQYLYFENATICPSGGGTYLSELYGVF